MKTKTCGECLYYDDPFCDYHEMQVARMRKSCDLFEPKEKPPTNGDKIRQMSDDELAELLTTPPCFMCSKGDASGECTDPWEKKNCKNAILIKLKQEIKK
jgi:hypothetical protein